MQLKQRRKIAQESINRKILPPCTVLVSRSKLIPTVQATLSCCF